MTSTRPEAVIGAMGKRAGRRAKHAAEPIEDEDRGADRPIAPTTARYIKLGRGGAYERACLEEGVLRLGFNFIPHETALSGDLEAMKTYAAKRRGGTRASADDARQVHDFYHLGEDTLWITFVDGRLFWCFAEADVEWEEPQSESNVAYRIRRCKTPWRDASLTGGVLRKSSLNGALTKVAAYRGSICRVEALDYLVRKINGEEIPEVAAANALRRRLLDNIQALFKLLGWRDFELLVELVFAGSGWRRTGALGGTQKTVDLELVLPSTGERAFVQVKSQTRQAELDKYLEHLRGRDEARMFFIYHSADGPLAAADDNCILIGPARLAEMVLEAGLYDWLIQKAD